MIKWLKKSLSQPEIPSHSGWLRLRADRRWSRWLLAPSPLCPSSLIRDPPTPHPPGLRSPSQSCGWSKAPRQSPGWPLAGEALPDAGLGSCTDPGSNPGSASYQLRDPDESLKGPKPLLPTLERASWAVVWMQCVDTSSGGPRVGHPWEQPAWGRARVCSLEGISKQ